MKKYIQKLEDRAKSHPKSVGAGIVFAAMAVGGVIALQYDPRRSLALSKAQARYMMDHDVAYIYELDEGSFILFPPHK